MSEAQEKPEERRKTHGREKFLMWMVGTLLVVIGLIVATGFGAMSFSADIDGLDGRMTAIETLVALQEQKMDYNAETQARLVKGVDDISKYLLDMANEGHGASQ